MPGGEYQHSEFRIRLNGVNMPEVYVRPLRGRVGNQLEVRDDLVGWIVVDDNEGVRDGLPKFKLEYRDETAWALLPVEMCRNSVDKGWNECTAQELIGVLWNAGVLR